MNYFALIIDGVVAEVFPEFVNAECPGTPIRAVPLVERYTSEFIATLVPYDPENPPAPPVPPAPTAAQVMNERAARMAQATAEIAPLQDSVDFGDVSEEDEAKLIAWKTYRVAVSKVQTQEDFPDNVIWPVAPGV